MMSSQEHASEMLSHWQAQRRVEPKDRRLSGDIGSMSFCLRANAKDLCDIWMQDPGRRAEFGDQEIQDIAEAVLGLSTLLREIKRRDAA